MAYHTTFVDLYGLAADFPSYSTSKSQKPYNRVKTIEQAIAADISHNRFIPFIQLHEYEALLFANPSMMEDWLSLYNKVPVGCFQEIVRQCEGNPELINEDPSTAPSKRILSLCPVYDKIDDGILILKEIGLNNLRSQCSHFDEWVTVLESLT